MKKKVIIGVCAAVLVLAGGSAAYAANTVYNSDPDLIAEGVYAGDIDLSGLTEEEAKSTLEEFVAGLQDKTVTLTTDSHEDTVSMEDLGLTWNNESLVEEAVSLGKTGNMIARFKELTDLKNNHQVYELDFSFDETKVNELMETLKSYNQEAVEPSIALKDGSFVVTPEENGVTVDEEATMNAIYALLDSDWSGDNATVETVTEIDKPEHTASELEAISDSLGSCTTKYSTSNKGRTQSLELSASRVNGTVIWPGETISVSTLMGERSQAGGYGTGLGYFGTDVEETVGAGICQTASTLYDAALYAELDVVERYNHSLIVHYVDYAMDSTIYAGSDYKNPQKDLKLKNPYDYPVYLYVSAYKGTETVKIYGKETRPSNRTVKYISTTLSESTPTGVTYTNDPTHYEGWEETTQAAYPAVKASLTKIVYVDGVETERTVLHTDTYKGANKKVTRGTKKKEVETTKAAETSSAAGGSESSQAAESQAAETTKAPETTKAAETTKAPAAEGGGEGAAN